MSGNYVDQVEGALKDLEALRKRAGEVTDKLVRAQLQNQIDSLYGRLGVIPQQLQRREEALHSEARPAVRREIREALNARLDEVFPPLIERAGRAGKKKRAHWLLSLQFDLREVINR